MRRLWHILSGNSLKPNHSLASLCQSTRALLKFCEDHDAPDKARALRAVLTALEADDRLAATRAFKAIPFGGNGSFADWFPPAKFANETPDYTEQVFIALAVQ